MIIYKTPVMSKKLIYYIVVFLILGTNISFSQETSETEGTEETKEFTLKDADIYFENENYVSALPIYLELDLQKPKLEYKFKIGVCYLFKTDEKQKSIEYLEQVLNEKGKFENLYFYLGRAYQLNYRFDDAIRMYNDAKSKKTSSANKISIDHLIKNCENGKKFVEDPVIVRIENIGKPINTKYDEYVPVISADESVLMFTYRGEKSMGGLQNEYGEPDPKGKYFEDILMSVKLGGETWSDPERLGENINIRGHDACLALSANGEQLFIYKDTEGSSGDIYISDLDGYTWSDPIRLDTTINTQYWEGNASLSSNGKTLYFSSEGHNSMGGYDIFQSVFDEKTGTWSSPKNLGVPINTPNDDVFFVLAANGKHGYYSSIRSDGFGEKDIYRITFLKDSIKPQLTDRKSGV